MERLLINLLLMFIMCYVGFHLCEALNDRDVNYVEAIFYAVCYTILGVAILTV